MVITDREPLSLECAALSATASGFAAFSPMSPLGGYPGASLGSVGAPPGITCALLDWSLPVPSELLGRCVGIRDGWELEGWEQGGGMVPSDQGGALGCKCFIWVAVATEARNYPVTAACMHETPCRFDIVLATDVLYEHFSVPMLARVVSQLTSQEDGASSPTACLLLAEYPDRYPSNLRNFQDLMQVGPEGNTPLPFARADSPHTFHACQFAGSSIQDDIGKH